MIQIIVDEKKLAVEPGTRLLQACLENDIYIPHLCWHEQLDVPSASCRLCFVEVEGRNDPVTACTVEVADGMRLRTDTPAVLDLRKAAFELLLSVHKVECGVCPANKRCELQRIAKFLKTGLKSKNLPVSLKPSDIDSRHPCLDYYPNRCVLCGRCIHACRTRQSRPHLAFAGRGFKTTLTLLSIPDDPGAMCADCRACIEICPVAALQPKENLEP